MFQKSTGSLAVLAIIVPLLAAPCLDAASESDEIIVSVQDIDEYLPEVAYNSVRDEYLVVWHDSSPLQARSIMARRYTAAGAFIAEHVIAFEDSPPRDNAQPSVAYDPVNDRYLVVWVRDVFGDASDWDVYGRFVPWNGPIAGLAAFPINQFTSKQWNPRVAYGGTVQEFMITWWNEGSGAVSSYISAQRVFASGNVVPGTITVTSDLNEERVAPDIAYNQARNEYFVVYQKMDGGGGNIYGVRLSGTGSLLGGGDYGIAAWPSPETAPRISASRVSDRWAVVWQSEVSATNFDVYARLFWIDGMGDFQMETPVHLDWTAINESMPDIAAYPESSNFLVTWEQQYSSTTGPYGIRARVLNATNVLGRVYVPRDSTIGETLACSRPAVAGGDDDWMVVWEHPRDDTPSYQDIHGRILIDEIFSDGFESGGTSEWSSTVP